jgi:hypothetical protein
MTMRIETRKRGRAGWDLTLVTPLYRYTLWFDWPRLTKFSRHPLKDRADPWGRYPSNADYGKEPPEGSTLWIYWHEHRRA